jgi:hypothetical protein
LDKNEKVVSATCITDLGEEENETENQTLENVCETGSVSEEAIEQAIQNEAGQPQVEQ